ncbi:MAG TPA: PilT/PilU family type 4a pilus ATPase [Planctomycetaceae bacterium]|nr:PilT/PilU family type 4a pilus ATPase [Planctomycetaceae bacterium]
MSWTLDKILKGARRLSASDVHLVSGLAPLLRITGEIHPIEGEPLDEHLLKEIVGAILSEKQRQSLEENWQLCFSRQWADVGRCRISVYFRAGCPEMAIRLCETRVRGAEELGLPPIVSELTRLPSGLVLVTGPTGTGKTTTLNFLIDAINRQRRAKIVTIEDPVEFVHENLRSIVIQQEVMTDVLSFRSALIHVLRQDPDVIVIGEMRDLETIETALIAAETGHLVMATLHTPDSVQTVQRIYSVFPAEQQNAIVVQLANSLQAIIAQKLLPRADGKGRVLAAEVCVATPAVRNHIREGQVHQLYSEMQTGKKHQMQTIDHSLLSLYQRGEITYDTALSHARVPDHIRQRAIERPA